MLWLDEGEIVMFLDRNNCQGFITYFILYGNQKYSKSFGYRLISDCFEKAQ